MLHVIYRRLAFPAKAVLISFHGMNSVANPQDDISGWCIGSDDSCIHVQVRLLVALEMNISRHRLGMVLQVQLCG